ncbi:hypothetical protein [Promicromonospora panici]|uniref:hypothetical protein n=1 Tax=Promicromonospora panici TaxID=2219658 RepID=UPI00101BEDAA|nr:hypothetical protein [Promicromonospora panici]
MFTRRITKKDLPDILNAMGNDLDASRVMVGRMQDWAAETGLGALAEALDWAVVALTDAHDAAHDAYRTATDETDETDKEARER